MDKGVNAIWTKRGNCILAEGGYFTWPKGSKLHGFSNTPYHVYVNPQETVEITCFAVENPNGDPLDDDSDAKKDAGRWELTNRFGIDNFKLDNTVGRFPRCLCFGHLEAKNNGVKDFLCETWDSKIHNLKCIYQGLGVFKFSFDKDFSPNGYWVMITPVGIGTSGGGLGNTDSSLKVSIADKKDDSFTVLTSAYGKANNGSFDFVMFSRDWMYQF